MLTDHSEASAESPGELDPDGELLLPIDAVEQEEILVRQEEEESEWLQQFEYLLDHAAPVRSA